MPEPLPFRHSVIVSLGSNADAERNVCEALQRLQGVLEECQCSERLWTKPVGKPQEVDVWPCEHFLNVLVVATTSKDIAELEEGMKRVEQTLGRTEEEKRRGIVRIDIDLLAYDGQRFHEEDWERDYVKTLMKNEK